MRKPLALLFLSLTIACSAWAEKYEYLRLKAKNLTGEAFTYKDASQYIYDSVELKSGDVARVVGLAEMNVDWLFFYDGENYHKFNMTWTVGGSFIQTKPIPGESYSC